MKKTISLVLVLVWGLVIGEPVRATTITIGLNTNCDFGTIQEGIDAAIDRDTVVVAPGEYVITQPITFRGKAITVQSETGPDETIIRMGTPADSNRGSVVVFESNETATSLLEGFTITGGKGSLEPSANEWGGGGILFNASSAIVRNCMIVDNSTGYGGGICCVFTCSPILNDCNIVENSTEEDGGGVLLWSGPSPSMTNCTIRENSSTGFGGGIHCCKSCLLELTRCAIMENSVTIVGGGMFCEEYSSVTMTNCIISGNSATGRHQFYPGLGGAGGMDFWGNTSLTLTHCTITGNPAADNAGGMVCDFGCSGSVTNSIVCENTAPRAPNISLIFGSTLDITYSNVAGGRAAVNVEGGSILNWGGGNIDADPYFVDPTNDDFHLKSQAGRWNPEKQAWIQDDITSPCIDTGDPMSPIGLEPFPNGGFVNMGASGGTDKASKTYFGEPVCETIIAGDINGDGQVNRADLEIMALHWTDEEPLLP